MTKVITVLAKPNQTIWDVALEQHGSILSIFAVIDLNEEMREGVNSDIVEGMEIGIDSDLIVDEEVKEYYDQKGIVPAGGEFGYLGDFNNDFNNNFNNNFK